MQKTQLLHNLRNHLVRLFNVSTQCVWPWKNVMASNQCQEINYGQEMWLLKLDEILELFFFQ